MHPTLSRLPPLHLDAKRIVATSGAIAAHGLALMLLMLPMQRPPSRLLEATTMTVVPEFIKRPPIPIPRPLAPVTAAPPAQRPTPTPQTPPVDSAPAPVDTYLPAAPSDGPASDDFAPPATPAFAQISADVAPAPPYPALALRRHLSGVVMLRLRVGVDGRPLAAAIETSSGSGLLDEAARKFVLARWHFIPATQDGHAIEAEALVPISFVIDR